MALTSVAALESQPQVLDALRSASADCGVDFSYLLTTAQRESGLNPQAASKTSTATGLFQFVKQTWLATLKEHGGEHGYGAYADAIGRDDAGRYFVSDPSREAEILALRTNPQAASSMAAELTRETSDLLQSRLGRAPSTGELYAAHVLGAGGATRLITLAGSQPDISAEMIFPDAAGSNPGLFNDHSGAPVTVGALYDRLTGAQGASCPAPTMAVASPLISEDLEDPSEGHMGASVWRPILSNTSAPSRYPVSGRYPIAVPSPVSSLSSFGFGAVTLKLSPEVLAVLMALDPLKPTGADPRHSA